MDVPAILQRAQLLVDVGRQADADDLVRAALAEDPDDADLLTAHATLALRSGDVMTAYRSAVSAISAAPGSTMRARHVLARVYLVAELPDAAVGIARQAVELDPNDADAHALLATCLSYGAGFGRARRDARAAIDSAVELAPDNAELLYETARAAQRMNDTDLRRKLVDAGLQADPTHVELQVMRARGRELTSAKAGALTEVLAADPTHELARHALAEVMWGSIARLASGVWIYALAVILLSAWIPVAAVRHLVPVLMFPLVAHWAWLLRRARRRLPRRYLSKRLWRNPFAAGGVVLAAIAGLLAFFCPVLLAVAWDSEGVRLGYQTLIFVCLLAGFAHLLVTLGRIRRGGDVDLGAHVREQTGTGVNWLVGLGVPIAAGWAFYRLARQPGALWFALMLLPIVLAVLGVEATLKTWRLPGSRRSRLIATGACLLFVTGCGWLAVRCGHETLITEFHYTVGPLSPENLQVPTFTPLPPIHIPTVLDVPSVPPR